MVLPRDGLCAPLAEPQSVWLSWLREHSLVGPESALAGVLGHRGRAWRSPWKRLA